MVTFGLSFRRRSELGGCCADCLMCGGREDEEEEEQKKLPDSCRCYVHSLKGKSSYSIKAYDGAGKRWMTVGH